MNISAAKQEHQQHPDAMTSKAFHEDSDPERDDDEDTDDDDDTSDDVIADYFAEQLREQAEKVLRLEPEMSFLLNKTVLAPDTRTFEHIVARTLCHRLLLPTASVSTSTSLSDEVSNCGLSPLALYDLTMKCMRSKLLEHGSTMADAVRSDAMAVVERDPAMDTLLEVVLFAKGFAALVAHRVAYRLWYMKRKYAALFLQSQTSAVFGLDIHPLARIGKGVMFDHGTAVVVGETATIGKGCTILHSVTLGGTGKDHGDRHPKVGDHVLIGAGSLLLGNIQVGHSAKIGAGSVLLRSIPPHATAVGVPARIIGRAEESDPGQEMDVDLHRVSLLHRVPSSIATNTNASTVSLMDAVTDTSISSVGLAPASHHSSSDDVVAVPVGLESTTKTNRSSINECSDHREIFNTADMGSFRKLHGVNINDEFCPYREYYSLADEAPEGTVTIRSLRDALLPKGMSSCKIGACFFEMDQRGKGYIKPSSFVRVGPEAISRTFEIPIDEATKLVQETISMSAQGH